MTNNWPQLKERQKLNVWRLLMQLMKACPLFSILFTSLLISVDVSSQVTFVKNSLVTEWGWETVSIFLIWGCCTSGSISGEIALSTRVRFFVCGRRVPRRGGYTNWYSRTPTVWKVPWSEISSDFSLGPQGTDPESRSESMHNILGTHFKSILRVVACPYKSRWAVWIFMF